MKSALAGVAVLGCGRWGRNLVRNFHSLGALAAICDESTDVAAATAREYNVPALSIAHIMSDPSIEGIVIATPAATHSPLALRAIAAGKHVYVEKPLALNVTDAKRMGDAADAAKRVLMVGHLLRYHPAFQALLEVVQDGGIGRLRHISTTRLNLGQIRREEDVFWSLAPHDISMIIALAGTTPNTVLATATSCLHDSKADIVTAHLHFDRGLDARVNVSWLNPIKQQTLTAIGEAGMLVFDDIQPWPRKLLLYPHKIVWRDGQPLPVRADPVPVSLQEEEPLSLECRHFMDCISAGARPNTDWREGLAVVRVLDAGQRSMTTGQTAVLSMAVADFFQHSTALVDPGCQIGSGTRIWHYSHILKGSHIGSNCVIGQNVMIGPDVNIGDNCKIQNNVSLYSGVTLEDGVFCGPSCVFTNVNNPRAEIERKTEFRETLVGHGATIGANATIICGRRIGRYAFVAAGAVVTHDVPAHALVAGNPARRIGWMSEDGYRLGDDLICPQTGRHYIPDGNGGLRRQVNSLEIAQ